MKHPQFARVGLLEGRAAKPRGLTKESENYSEWSLLHAAVECQG